MGHEEDSQDVTKQFEGDNEIESELELFIKSEDVVECTSMQKSWRIGDGFFIPIILM